MELITVVLKSTSGEETSSSARLDGDTVVLPQRLCDRIRDIQSTGEQYALRAKVRGRTWSLRPRGGSQYDLEDAMQVGDSVWVRVRKALTVPTWDQHQGFARLVHTLSAASFVGLATVATDLPAWGWFNAAKCFALAGLGIIFLVLGAIFLKGE